jgi:bifunctional DNA-binding transcriptional regulator/antitoxin component of YhaV-PrlF toxin-antitoxin module
MDSVITKGGATSIPLDIRTRYQLQPGDRLIWLDDGNAIRLVPVPADPLRALRGAGRGEKLVERLLTARQQERDRE